MKRRIALGIGLSSKAGPEELARLIGDVLLDAGVEPSDVDVVGTIDTRLGHDAFATLRWPVVGFTAEELGSGADAPRVAEPAALLAAGLEGDEAAIVVDKRRSSRATVALAVARESATRSLALAGGSFERARAAVVPPDDQARADAEALQLRLTKPAGRAGPARVVGNPARRHRRRGPAAAAAAGRDRRVRR